jgi:hypothetical protein
VSGFADDSHSNFFVCFSLTLVILSIRTANSLEIFQLENSTDKLILNLHDSFFSFVLTEVEP